MSKKKKEPPKPKSLLDMLKERDMEYEKLKTESDEKFQELFNDISETLDKLKDDISELERLDNRKNNKKK